MELGRAGVLMVLRAGEFIAPVFGGGEKGRIAVLGADGHVLASICNGKGVLSGVSGLCDHGGAPRRPAVIAQAGYTGQNPFSVTYGGQNVPVRAEDGYAALFTAAKHWGYKFTRPEYHQNARATKLHYTPDTRPGALV